MQVWEDGRVAVSDASSVDTIAEGPDGRLVMAMSEERRYAGGDQAAMVEDFRRKLNGYVYAIRSGQLRQMAGSAVDRGVQIQLFCMDEPPPRVLEMIRLANDDLAAEGVVVDWSVHAPTTDEVLREVAVLMSELAPAGWASVVLHASLVGAGLAGSFTATMPSGEVEPLQPAESLIGALQSLKAACWTPEEGTWITFYGRIEGEQLFPDFTVDRPPPNGPEEFPAEDWAEELRRYPRQSVPDWWRARMSSSRS
ncbi:hypothetical protein GCM10011575_32290 [Microlunatus endophyticus]|uniref:Uncharacterized protein n=1 Tax=Microlunatus endophyticus TaxID=1716077 RepID=A0A917SDG9_9ACTN|nr:hypothetical protein [Microlunatus endophyticus]GGL71506.1 hypothetical protein GCM10011575_32290 [Microlunatus endophyticus]